MITIVLITSKSTKSCIEIHLVTITRRNALAFDSMGFSIVDNRHVAYATAKDGRPLAKSYRDGVTVHRRE